MNEKRQYSVPVLRTFGTAKDLTNGEKTLGASDGFYLCEDGTLHDGGHLSGVGA